MPAPTPTIKSAAGPRRRGEWPEIVFANDAKRSTLSQAVSRGRLIRLASGIYTGAVDADPADVSRRAWWKVLVHEYPGAVITDRSARSQAPVDGVLTIVPARRRPLAMPGLTISPRRARGRRRGWTIVSTPSTGACGRALRSVMTAPGYS